MSIKDPYKFPIEPITDSQDSYILQNKKYNTDIRFDKKNSMIKYKKNGVEMII